MLEDFLDIYYLSLWVIILAYGGLFYPIGDALFDEGGFAEDANELLGCRILVDAFEHLHATLHTATLVVDRDGNEVIGIFGG